MKTSKKKNQWVKQIFILLISFVIVAFVIYITKELLSHLFSEGFAEVLAGIVAFAGTILAAIINNYYQRMNQIESDERIRKSQIEADNRKEKLKNYNELLEMLKPLVRRENSSRDGFMSVHLKSWIFGNEEVINSTAMLVEQWDSSNGKLGKEFKVELKNLLGHIRLDIGLEKLSNDIELSNPFPKDDNYIKE